MFTICASCDGQSLAIGPDAEGVALSYEQPVWRAPLQIRHPWAKLPAEAFFSYDSQVNQPQFEAAASASPQWILTLSCPDRSGIVAAVAGAVANAGGNIVESQQFGDDSGSFFMRVQVDMSGSTQVGAGASGPQAARDDAAGEVLRSWLRPVGEKFTMDWNVASGNHKMRTLVMVSKAGHCLNDLLFRQRSGQLPIEIPAIVSNHTDLQPLAEFYGVPFFHVPVTPATKAEAEARVQEIAAEQGIELVVLARYMQVLSDQLCRAFEGRAINIHHSFLPSFKGAKPYHQAHERGVKIIGATAHYVTADLDEGPIIEQDVERVSHNESASDLVARGQDVECRALARAVRWHAQHRVLRNGHRTVVFH
ncbi:formyltetrahydrofolate deformylase [Micrococcales bacterium 31B]|nr:formyltetrahydrofolate deformylase [Micrococcales bacterium 31B]